MNDIFRPLKDPARRLYDAFQDEGRKRNGKTFEEWHTNEKKRVWSEARDYAQEHGLKAPTMQQVEDAERSASGHTDYGSKWAYGVSKFLANTKDQPLQSAASQVQEP